MTLDLLRRLHAWTEGALSPAGTQSTVQDFVDAPVWLPGTRPPPGSSGHAVQRLHLFPGPAGALPVLGVWLQDPAGFHPPVTTPTLHQTGGAVLAYVMNQRFDVALEDSGEQCRLSYDDLLSLRALMLAQRLARGEPVEPAPTPDLGRLVAPLLAHCAAEPSVRRAWLAVVHAPTGHQAAVMLDTTQPDRHRVALTQGLDPMLPPGVSLTVFDTADVFMADLCRAMGRHEPLHDASARPGWTERMRQRFVRPAVPVIPLDVHR